MLCPNCQQELMNVNGRYVCINCGTEVPQSQAVPSSNATEATADDFKVDSFATDPVPQTLASVDNHNFEIPETSVPSMSSSLDSPQTGELVVSPPVSENTGLNIGSNMEQKISDLASLYPAQTVSENAETDLIQPIIPEEAPVETPIETPVENVDLVPDLGQVQEQAEQNSYSAKTVPLSGLPVSDAVPSTELSPEPSVEEIPVIVPESAPDSVETPEEVIADSPVVTSEQVTEPVDPFDTISAASTPSAPITETVEELVDTPPVDSMPVTVPEEEMPSMTAETSENPVPENQPMFQDQSRSEGTANYDAPMQESIPSSTSLPPDPRLYQDPTFDNSSDPEVISPQQEVQDEKKNFQPIANKKLYIIIGIGVFFAIALLVGGIILFNILTAPAKVNLNGHGQNQAQVADCGVTGPDSSTSDSRAAASCFAEKFSSCSLAKLSTVSTPETGAVTYNYEIKGTTDTACSIESSFSKNPIPEYMNKSMTCAYDNTKSFSDAAAALTADSCTGDLSSVMFSGSETTTDTSGDAGTGDVTGE